MKILVLSDSHCALSVMRHAISVLRPDTIIHLGDHYDDGETIAQENPHLRVHQVAGNCDRFRCLPGTPELLCYEIGGVRIFMAHGHNHGVKSSPYRLIRNARELGAKIALFGHTHQPVCFQEEDGIWVLNPGTCGSFGGSVGLIEVNNGQILSCRVLPCGQLTG